MSHPDDLPKRGRRAALRVVGAAILDGSTCLVAQRGPEAAGCALQWEFPGGKVEADETPRSALVREVREELGVEIEVGERLGRGSATSGGIAIDLEVYAAVITSGEIRLAEHCRCGWFRAGEIDALDWAAADRPVLTALKCLLLRQASW